MNRYNIVLVGSGNMAWHLGKQLQALGHNIIEVFSRTRTNAEWLAQELETDYQTKFDKVTKEGDIYLLALSDHGIDDAILSLRVPGKVVAHTSGAVPMTGMGVMSENYGVFYPLQTLTKGIAVDFSNVPFFIEAANEPTNEILTDLARQLSSKVLHIPFEKKQALHVAAVFANNFTNYMYTIASEILDDQKLSFELLRPLLEETLNKLKHTTAEKAQTGPARRDDFRTINEHLEFLMKNENAREVYLVLSESIMQQNKAIKEWDDESLSEVENEDTLETDSEDDFNTLILE